MYMHRYTPTQQYIYIYITYRNIYLYVYIKNKKEGKEFLKAAQ